MFCDQNGMEMNNRKIFLIPIKGIYEKPKTNIILNDETLNAFSLTRDKCIHSYHFYSAYYWRLWPV